MEGDDRRIITKFCCITEISYFNPVRILRVKVPKINASNVQHEKLRLRLTWLARKRAGLYRTRRKRVPLAFRFTASFSVRRNVPLKHAEARASPENGAPGRTRKGRWPMDTARRIGPGPGSTSAVSLCSPRWRYISQKKDNRPRGENRYRRFSRIECLISRRANLWTRKWQSKMQDRQYWSSQSWKC